MAETFMEAVGVFRYFGFQYLMVPLLIFVLVLGFLQRTKLLGDKADLNAAVALAVAFLSMMVPGFVDFVYALIPFFVAFVVILFGAALVFMLLGAKAEDIFAFTKRPEVTVFLLVLSVIITFYVIGQQFGHLFSPYANVTNESQTLVMREASQRIFNPKVLGTIIFLAIISIGIYLLTVPKK
ncbi:hypothetical protein DRN62_00290 [Nanoarchaeota archaeon]|nr:MAG: hypothetical protein DRN62_00290 [Nanoarchaeota archaeon]